MVIQGKVHNFGDNINTDEIIPATYLNILDPKELGRHCFETLVKDFSKKVSINDIIVAGKNFGCGSSREHAPLAIKGAGIGAVIAQSFARIFYRNCINIGLPILEIKDARYIKSGDRLLIDLRQGVIKNLTKSKIYEVKKLPVFIREIINSGGLMRWVAKSR